MDSQKQSTDKSGEQKAASAPKPANKMKDTKYKLNPIRFALTKFTIYETKSVSRKLHRKFTTTKINNPLNSDFMSSELILVNLYGR